MKETNESSVAVAKYCAQILDAYKLEEIEVLEVLDSLQIAEYFVVASGKNRRQLKAASNELFKRLREAGVTRLGVEGYREASWILVDLIDVVVHLFLPESRHFYDLDSLWGDCPKVPWSGRPARSVVAGGRPDRIASESRSG